jgi:cytochrome c556
MGVVRRSIAVAGLVCMLAAGAAFAMTSGEVVQARRAQFGEMSAWLKAAADRWQDPSRYFEVARAGSVIQQDAKRLLQLFPDGTAPGDGVRTAALDSVWSDRAGFDRLVNQLADQAAQLAGVTQSSSSDEVRQRLVDIIGTCKACHRDYRAQ